MVEVATSLLNVDSKNCMKTFYDLEVAGTDYFHIDVMDGVFVENDTISIMNKYCEYLKHISLIPLDIHLMVQDVKKYVDEFLNYEPNIISFQIEALNKEEQILEVIKYIKQNNCKVGLAIKPQTKIEDIYKYIPLIHQVVIMTVEPGKGGQELIKETTLKISELKEYITQNNIDIDIEVDGGITEENVEGLKEKGANIIVAGTAIVGSKDFKETINNLKK